jgi:hypothetical protein
MKSQRPNFHRALICLASLAMMTACSVSTSHLTDIKLSNDKDLSTPTTTFAKTDTVYAQAGAANLASPVTLQWHLIAEKVAGQAPNSVIPGLDKSFDLPSDGTSTYNLSPPTAGFPAGTYKLEVDMMVDGAQKDQKTAEFTVQ